MHHNKNGKHFVINRLIISNYLLTFSKGIILLFVNQIHISLMKNLKQQWLILELWLFLVHFIRLEMDGIRIHRMISLNI